VGGRAVCGGAAGAGDHGGRGRGQAGAQRHGVVPCGARGGQQQAAREGREGPYGAGLQVGGLAAGAVGGCAACAACAGFNAGARFKTGLLLHMLTYGDSMLPALAVHELAMGQIVLQVLLHASTCCRMALARCASQASCHPAHPATCCPSIRRAMALRQDPYPRTITYPFVAKWLLQYVCKQLQNRPLRATAHQFFIPPRGSTPLLELQWQGSQTRTSKLIESVTSWLQHDLAPPELLELEQKLWTWLYTVCCRPAGNSSSNSSSSEVERLVEEAPPPPRNKGGRPRKDQQQAQQKAQQKAQQAQQAQQQAQHMQQQAPAPMPMPADAPPPHGPGYPPGYPPAYPGHYPGAPPSVAYDYSQHQAHMMYKPPAGYPGAQPGPMPGPHPHAPAPWPAAYSQPYPGYAPPAAPGPAPGGPMYQSSMAPPVSRQMYAGHPAGYIQPAAGAAGGAPPQQQQAQQQQQQQQQQAQQQQQQAQLAQGQWNAAGVAGAGV
jgi:hypothetical protein